MSNSDGHRRAESRKGIILGVERVNFLSTGDYGLEINMGVEDRDQD